MIEYTSVTAVLFRQNKSGIRFTNTVEVDRHRMLNFQFSTHFSKAWEILEFIFAATNSPRDFLNQEQVFIAECFNGAGLYGVSVGDVIQLDEKYYMCDGEQWKQIENFQETYSKY